MEINAVAFESFTTTLSNTVNIHLKDLLLNLVNLNSRIVV